MSRAEWTSFDDAFGGRNEEKFLPDAEETDSPGENYEIWAAKKESSTVKDLAVAATTPAAAARTSQSSRSQVGDGRLTQAPGNRESNIRNKECEEKQDERDRRQGKEKSGKKDRKETKDKKAKKEKKKDGKKDKKDKETSAPKTRQWDPARGCYVEEEIPREIRELMSKSTKEIPRNVHESQSRAAHPKEKDLSAAAPKVQTEIPGQQQRGMQRQQQQQPQKEKHVAHSPLQPRRAIAGAAPSLVVDSDGFSMHKGFSRAVGDLLVETMTPLQAKAKCPTMPGCHGFMFKGDASHLADVPVKMHFIGKGDIVGSTGWITYRWHGKSQTTSRQRQQQTKRSSEKANMPSGKPPHVHQKQQNRREYTAPSCSTRPSSAPVTEGLGNDDSCFVSLQRPNNEGKRSIDLD
mmetsp:Transcript_139303/g.277797  ORF Transcript_139303/g.277797 Transcript_139303/m.277797 type:complete len:406 (-) Transcript_139303:49-1266(-)